LHYYCIPEVTVRVEEERRPAKLDELAANQTHIDRVALDNPNCLDENLCIYRL
jgi:hypothetical protein